MTCRPLISIACKALDNALPEGTERGTDTPIRWTCRDKVRPMNNPIFSPRPSVTGASFHLALLTVTLTAALTARPCPGFTPESPEVKRAMARGLEFLASNAEMDSRIGAVALVGHCLLRHESGFSHPRVAWAAKFIQESIGDKEAADLDPKIHDIYSMGLAVIFLVHLDPEKYAPEITLLLESLRLRQKPHGGWGYHGLPAGDTSMTQYGVLSCWEADRAGFDVPIDMVEKVAVWLMKTQDPEGGFGYQANVSPSFEPIKQWGVRHSMVAAGLGSTYICTDLLGLNRQTAAPAGDTPPGLKKIEEAAPKEDVSGPKTQLSPQLFRTVQERGIGWFNRNYKIDPPGQVHYYLYALERCMSFRELCEGKSGKTGVEDGPPWFNDGVRYLLETQADNGSWSSSKDVVPDTAFAVLINRMSIRLLHSANKSVYLSR